MSTLKAFLQTMSKGLWALAEEVDKIENIIDELETRSTKKTKGKRKPGKKQAKKTPAKKTARKTVKKTATGAVMAAIERSRKGVDTATLKKKTGLTDKQIWNIINRLKREGKIKSAQRGIYVKA
ncbi:hypothetical protein ACFL9T_23620 [Thermodesulfobacteriota bacterium]